MAVGAPAMLWLDRFAVGGGTLRWGAAGLALGSAAGALAELAALRRRLVRHRPGLALPGRRLALHAALALAALLPAVLAGPVFEELPSRLAAGLALALFGAVYLGLARLAGLPELEALASVRLRRR